MTAKQDEILKELKKKYDELNYKWSVERDKYEAKAQHLSAEARKQFEKSSDEFRKFRKEMKAKIVDLEVAGENAWNDVKEGADTAWNAMSKAFEKAASHFKK